MDQLLNLVWSLASELKSVKEELNEVKSAGTAIVAKPPEIIEPWAHIEEVKREVPYKVIPIESIIRDESYVNLRDAPNGWIKKIYRWLWRTFPNKKLATEYLDAAKKRNPWQQYDIFPV